MSMASTIQPYGNDKNRPLSLANMGGLGLGDQLMEQIESATINKNRQMAATAGVPKNVMGPMTLSALQGSYFG